MIRCTQASCKEAIIRKPGITWRWTWMFGWRCPDHLPGKVTP